MAIRLGYDTYTIRALNWNAFQHLDYAQQQKLDAIQFSDLNNFGSLEPAYLAKVKQRGRSWESGWMPALDAFASYRRVGTRPAARRAPSWSRGWRWRMLWERRRCAAIWDRHWIDRETRRWIS